MSKSTPTKQAHAVCDVCRDNHYILANRQGRLFAAVCKYYQCPNCNGNGKLYEEDERGFSFVADCECTEFLKRLNLLNEANIPGKFLEVDFSTFKVGTKAKEGSIKYAKTISMEFVKYFGKDNRGLVFMGSPGLGKTHLAVAVIRNLIFEKSIDCKFVDFFQLLSDIRHGYSQDLSEQELINPYVNSKVLVIDELAKGRNTEWELTILDQVISQRYNNADKITLFTTNYLTELPSDKDSKFDTRSQSFGSMFTQETLQDKVGPRIYSRLLETCKFLKMEGKDHRQSKSKIHHLPSY